MTSGRVQLAAPGLQDEFLTGSPDTSYFLKRFSRYTKFALEILDSSFDQSTIDFGSYLTCTIPRKGQLIRSMYLKLVLPVLSAGGYTDAIGHALIEWADLVIGGKTIERINGEYMQIYSQAFLGESQQNALTYLVGDTKGVGLGPASTDPANPYGPYPRTLMVPLPFYFIRNESLAIPLCALTRHEVEVRIKLRPLSQVTIPTTPVTSLTSLSASLPVEYVFLADDEVTTLQNTKIDYVITQLQLARDVLLPGQTSINTRLEFINPVKELFFIIQDSHVLQNNDYFNFKNTDTTNDNLDNLELTFNGEILLDSQVADQLYLSILQFMNCHTRVPEMYVYNYSFSIDPENYLPTGQVNMSRILNKILTINTTANTNQRDIRVYAKSYNILRIQSGISGVLFTDNNFI